MAAGAEQVGSRWGRSGVGGRLALVLLLRVLRVAHASGLCYQQWRACKHCTCTWPSDKPSPLTLSNCLQVVERAFSSALLEQEECMQQQLP